MNDKYTLQGHEAVVCNDLMAWGRWIQDADRHVDKTIVGDIRVSTVFLGLDHSCGEGPLQLFETMIFGGEFDQEMWRYSTWDEAEKGHKAAVEKVTEGSKD